MRAQQGLNQLYTKDYQGNFIFTVVPCILMLPVLFTNWCTIELF